MKILSLKHDSSKNKLTHYFAKLLILRCDVKIKQLSNQSTFAFWGESDNLDLLEKLKPQIR